MSHPNDPYGQGGQPSWPGQSGPQTPYQPNPYDPGPYQPDPYAQPHNDPYGRNTGQYPTQQQYPPTRHLPAQPYGGQPGGHGGGQYSAGEYGAGEYGGAQHGGTGPYGTGQYGGQYGGPPPGTPYAYGPLPPQPPQRRRTGTVVGALVAVVALVAAGIATYFFAFAGSAAGAPTPKEAAISLVTALSRNDVVGLLDGLAPAEGAVAKDYLAETLDQLKRLEIVKPDTRAEQITGITFKAENLVFDDAAEEKVNDHLAITKLVDGTITVSSDWSKVPLTERFLERAFPDGLPKNESQTVDVSDEIAKSNDGKPVRIATVKVGGEWYPSLFYSIADAALQDAGKSWPSRPVAANGTDSPQAAVQQLVEAALRGDVRRVVELMPPDEAAALHDAGEILVEEAKADDQPDVRITELVTKVEDVTGGKRVSFTKLSAENGDGEAFTLEVDGDCVKVDDGGDRQELCGKDLAEAIAELVELNGTSLTDQQLGAIERVVVGYLHSGLVATKVDGRWYVSPTRSLGDIGTGFLRRLQPGDLEALIDLGR